MAPTHDGATPHDYRGHVAGPAPVAQWLGLGLAPAAFVAHLQGAYLLVLADCGRDGGFGWVQLSGLLAIVIAGLGVYAAWLTWARAGREQPRDDGGPVPRTRFMGLVGLGVSGLTTLILVAQLVSGFVVPRCQ